MRKPKGYLGGQTQSDTVKHDYIDLALPILVFSRDHSLVLPSYERPEREFFFYLTLWHTTQKPMDEIQKSPTPHIRANHPRHYNENE